MSSEQWTCSLVVWNSYQRVPFSEVAKIVFCSHTTLFWEVWKIRYFAENRSLSQIFTGKIYFEGSSSFSKPPKKVPCGCTKQFWRPPKTEAPDMNSAPKSKLSAQKTLNTGLWSKLVSICPSLKSRDTARKTLNTRKDRAQSGSKGSWKSWAIYIYFLNLINPEYEPTKCSF